MNYLRQIQRGIDYIEANLDETIELSEVSKVAGHATSPDSVLYYAIPVI